MGALHAGHVSLIEAARETCDFVVTTIFVNPTQFAPNEDFSKYPRTFEGDLSKCQAAGCDLVFTPDTSQMYSDDASTVVRVDGLTNVLEGAHRPTHFDGVTTVVAKLFNITEPDQAFFGQKDYQQQLVIRRMVADLDFGLEIVTCPIVREDDGLAMSSRNRYLSADERKSGLTLSTALQAAREMAEGGASPSDASLRMREILAADSGVEVDYAVVADASSLELLDSADVLPAEAVALIAARIGATRLIDNCVLPLKR